MRITLLSYIVKATQPVLLILVIRAYGAAAFGLFAVVSALLMVMMRICMIGLDRGILWWTPRRPVGHEREGLLPALLWTLILSTALALATMITLAPTIAGWTGRLDAIDSLRWMVVGLVPMTATEVLASAAVARRRIEAHVFYKESVVAQVQVIAALALYHLGFADSGLSLAFTASWLVGLVGVASVFRRAYRGTRWSGPRLRLPPAMVRYSAGIWAADVVGVSFAGLDVFMLAGFTEPSTVGVYQGALQLATQVTAVRVSFQPFLAAVLAEISVEHQVERVRQGFSHALILILGIQLPLVAVILLFAAWILPLLGTGFGAGVMAAHVLTAGYLLNGSFGNAGLILLAFGRSDLGVINMLVSLGASAAAMTVLIPRFGPTGAALAVGLGYVVLTTLQLIESRRIVGAWFFSRDLARFLGLALVATAAAGSAWVLLAALVGPASGTVDLRDGLIRGGTFTAFAAVLGLGWWRLRSSEPGRRR
jgi:O-antigen/teichoic acid export membrane protein